EAGRFYLERASGRLYFVDDPRGHRVEATVAVAAFGGTAPDVLISNMTIEKYASTAQQGAIQARTARRWKIENCEVRLNSAGGIAVGATSQIRGCNVHHNGQIGITGVGDGVVIENNEI